MLLARLVTGRYGHRTIDEQVNSSPESARPNWVLRVLAAVLGRKSPA
jgi:hypothetical protein